MNSIDRFEAAVVGAGPAGIACALGLAREEIETVLFAGPHRPAGRSEDQRTAALFGCSIDYLVNLGVFEKCRKASEPIHGIRIIDDTGGLLRAPEVLFTAEDIGLEAFGYNVPQTDLVEALRRQADEMSACLTIVETAGVVGLKLSDQNAEITTAEGGTYLTQIVAAADGRNSLCRDVAGIGVDTHSYAQSALATIFEHERDHQSISTEFHRRNGPCTVVPMPGRRSSLVWVEKTDVAKRLCEMTIERFSKTLETRLQGLLGRVGSIGSRVIFPLSSLVAKKLASGRVVLIGEAGHVIPPIGAQGLNLSLRDGGVLVDLVTAAKARGEDLGSEKVMSDFHQARWFDITSRVGAVDLLNRSLISSIEPVQFVRGAGMVVLKTVGPLRRFVIRQGLGPQSGLPRIMQKGPQMEQGRAL